MKNVYFVGLTRTPVGKANTGSLASVRPDDLLSHVITEALKQSTVSAKDIQDVIVGCAMPEAEQGLNVARIASLLAGLPNTVPAMTINRYCSSGIQSMAIAHDRIASGGADVILAGGVESMSMIPMGGNKLTANPKFFEDDHAAIAYGMGITAEIVADRYNVSREDQDAFALLSHQRALKAQEAGYFKREISPFEVVHHLPDCEQGLLEVSKKALLLDEGVRSDTSLKALAKLRSPFKQDGSVTAGNTSQMSDGAGMAVLVSEDYLKKHKLKPLGRFVNYSIAGVPPEVMGIGPLEAIPLSLKKAGLTLDDIDWIELNEAFAAQSLAVIRELGLDPNKVNPYGGAIALGHPLGATGAIRAATCLYGLRRKKKRYGLVTMCIGTGMGFAAVIEAL